MSRPQLKPRRLTMEAPRLKIPDSVESTGLII